MISRAITVRLGGRRSGGFSVTRTARATSKNWLKSNSSSKRLFLGLLRFAHLLHDKRLRAIEFLLETVGKVVGAVFEKDDEAKREEYK
jgi:hypothetical protein